MTPISDPMSAFAIERAIDDGAAAPYAQFIGLSLADHRGEIGLSAVAALAETVMGATFYRSLPPGTATVQSRLTLSMPAPVKLGTRVRATGRVLGQVGDIGTTSVELVDETGAIVCAALGRGVVVSRATGKMPGHKSESKAIKPVVVQPPPPEPLDPELTGRDVLNGLTDFTVPLGPIQRLLEFRLSSVSDTEIQANMSPKPWMANNIGSMIGGVIVTAIIESCSLAVELTARPGQRFRISDITVTFLRSPALDDGDLTVTVSQVKTGRRITSVMATMSDAQGRQLAQATADAVS